MRARMAIRCSEIQIELREVVLNNKPPELLQASPKATVPVLVKPNGEVLEQSLDIMYWALNHNDPQNWLHPNATPNSASDLASLIHENDSHFKTHLDHYKYADRFPAHSPLHYRQQGEQFLAQLENRLQNQDFLCGPSASLADIALLPFIRQFAHVDIDWFNSAPYPKLINWLNNGLASDLFHAIMHKYPAWKS